jgi:hypothetical protein
MVLARAGGSFFEQCGWAARLLSVFFLDEERRVAGQRGVCCTKRRCKSDSDSALESGSEARLSVRALLRGGAEEFMRRMCAGKHYHKPRE